MRISGNEPSSVILRQNVDPKVPKQAEAKRDGVINPQNYNFNQFIYGKFWCSQNARNQPKLTADCFPQSHEILFRDALYVCSLCRGAYTDHFVDFCLCICPNVCLSVCLSSSCTLVKITYQFTIKLPYATYVFLNIQELYKTTQHDACTEKQASE